MSLLSPKVNNQDKELSIRPAALQDFIGQDDLRHNLQVFIKAAITRREALDHTLLYGPPGLGKTTLAQIIAYEMGANFKAAVGPALGKPADLASILTNLQPHDILFIDEIHRLHISLEEILYSAMEDACLDIVIGEGPAARTVKINLNKFTLIGATTRLGLISTPLRERFGIPLRLGFYSIEELQKVVIRGAEVLLTSINPPAALEIAKRSRGTPRIALKLLRRVRDFAHEGVIDAKLAGDALNSLKVDKVGLDSNDLRYLSVIANHYGGGPVGIETLAAALLEEKDAIEEVVEPYLIQIGLVQRTPRGRTLTKGAFDHLAQTEIIQ